MPELCTKLPVPAQLFCDQESQCLEYLSVVIIHYLTGSPVYAHACSLQGALDLLQQQQPKGY